MSGFESKRSMADDKLFERDLAIGYLTDSDYKYIMETEGGLELLNSYLQFGFKGYENFTDEELKAEIKEREWMENQ
jgi:hypothetical protein